MICTLSTILTGLTESVAGERLAEVASPAVRD
jgi:hypothetical protein